MDETELIDFVRGSFRSVWTLELLLFVHKNAEQSWKVEQLVRELRASDVVVREGLQSLQNAGLVVVEDGLLYRYAPANRVLDDTVAQLDTLYRERPLSVTRTIFSSPNERLKTFADAFRLKKDS